MAHASEMYELGGVDSRSNPLAIPQNRSLRCVNWVPNPGGWLELRRGYTLAVGVSYGYGDGGYGEGGYGGVSIGAPIHSLADYQILDSNGFPVRYLMIGAGTGVWTLKLSDGTLTQVGTLPTADKWGVFYANGQIHIGTKAGVWFWDGTKLRKNGIRSLSTTEAAAITVSIGLSFPNLSAAVAGFASGGSWAASDVNGEEVYAGIWDPASATMSPFGQIGSTRVQGATGQKLTVSSLPTLAAGQLWILGITADGGGVAQYVSARGSAHTPTALPGPGTAVLSGTTLTVQSNAHALTTGQLIVGTANVTIIQRSFRVNLTVNLGPLPVTVVDSNHYSVTMLGIPSGSEVSVTSAYQLLTGTTIVDGGYRIPNIQLNVTAGVPATRVTSAQPGYQLYACLYNPTTQHVGNRVAIGGRLAPIAPCTIVTDHLPDLRTEDSELQILIGSTIDGGEVPYALMDGNGTWLSVYPGTANTVLDGNYSLDFESELPSRNGVPPAMDRFCTIGDWVLGGTGVDTYVHVSGSAAAALNPVVLGRPEQSWAPDDVTMFPFREIPLNIQELGNDAVVFSNSHMARLVYAQGIWDWADTFPMGIAGRRAFTHSDQGPYWINYKKKLATIGTSGPVEVSGEYERALLSKIGDTYMDDVTLMHLHNVDKYQDQIVVKARDSNGNPFEVIHDFNLAGQSTYELGQNANGERTYQAQGQTTGQGYVRIYSGVLSADYVMADCEDVNGFSRCYYGGPDGNVYLGQEGWNDNGVEYSADYVGLQNLGPDRPSIFDICLWGDTDIMNQQVFSWRTDLDGLGDWHATEPQQFPGEEHDMRYHHQFSSGDLHMFYYRFQLNSHSVDAPTFELNDLPHLPLEGYGKIYMARAVFSDVTRGQ